MSHRGLLCLVLAGMLLLASCHPKGKQKPDSTQPLVTDVTSFQLDSLRILVQPSDNEAVAVALFWEGGVTNYPAEKAGLEEMTLLALMEGSADEEWRKTLRDAHAEFTVTCAEDWSMAGFTCLRDEVDGVWPLFADCVVQPAFPEEAVERARAIQLSRIYQEGQTAGGKTRQLLRDKVLPGMYHGKGIHGQAEYVKYLRPDDLREYYNALLMNRQRMVLVVSGDLDYEDVSEWVMDRWHLIQPRGYTSLGTPLTLPLASGVWMSQHDGLETQLTAVVKSPMPGSREEAALRLGLEVALQRTQDELDAQDEPPARMAVLPASTRWPYLSLVLHTASPTAAVGAVMEQLRKAVDQGVKAHDLDQVRARLQTRDLLLMETADARAFTLGRDALAHHWEDSYRRRSQLAQVTPSEATLALRKALPFPSWVVVGDTAQVDRQLLLQPFVREGK